MKRYRLPLILSGVGFLVGVVVSCGRVNTADSGKKGSVSLSSLNLNTIKISKGLNVNFPQAVKNLGKISAGLNLSAEAVGKKSLEACRTAQQVNEVFSLFSLVGRTFCHLEAEWASIEFGKKYNVTLTETGGPDERFGLWVDNTQDGKLVVYQCFNNQLQQKITIHAATEAGSKGSMVMKFSDSEEGASVSTDVGIALDFDISMDGSHLLNAQVSVDSGATSSYKESIGLALNTNGVSTFSSASKGVNVGKEFALRGVMKHNGSQGQAILRAKIFDEEYGGDIFYSSKSTFDAAGLLVENSTANEAVKVNATNLPAYLPAATTIEKPTGWDCQTGENLTLRLVSGGSAAAHQACLASTDSASFTDCFGDGYENGEDEDIDE